MPQKGQITDNWISIHDKLPRELFPVLSLIPEEDNEIAICVYEEREGFYLSYDCNFKCNVEYWCYIPEELTKVRTIKPLDDGR
jgi:hypothetical protein